MSSDLSVRIGRSVDLDQLMDEAAAAMCEMLGLSCTPVLSIERLQAGVRYPLTSATSDASAVYLVMVKEHGGAVMFVPYELSQSSGIPRDEAGLWAAVTVSGSGTNLAFALAAAVAIALAREVKTDIVDEALRWSLVMERDPDSFFQATRVSGRYSEIRAAADAFFAGLPVGKLETESQENDG